MLNIFIGWDSQEPLAFHVLCHSILRHASGPVSFVPLVQQQLRNTALYTRPPDQRASTEFSLTRFLVPALSNYQGRSIFLDCDMLMRDDVFKLAALANPAKAVSVCQHEYQPRVTTKFLGHEQADYTRKNWSSVMVFNNARCRRLTVQLVNQLSPAGLHRFEWVQDKEIGTLPLEWNFLVGESNQSIEAPKNIHYTNGGPWFREYQDCEYAQEWFDELDLAVPSLNIRKPVGV